MEARDLLLHLMNDPNTADEVISSECMRRIARRIEEEKQSMRNVANVRRYGYYSSIIL